MIKHMALSTIHPALPITMFTFGGSCYASYSIRPICNWRENRLMPKTRISNLYDRALEVLGDQERAEAWLKEPKKALGMKTPFQYADTEPGAREVENLLGRLEYGVFS